MNRQKIQGIFCEYAYLYILVRNERDFMKKFVLSLLMLSACMQVQSQEQPAVASQHTVDDLLTSALQDGVHQEIINPRELMWYEMVLRRVGGAVFLHYLMVHNYVKKIIAFES